MKKLKLIAHNKTSVYSVCSVVKKWGTTEYAEHTEEVVSEIIVLYIAKSTVTRYQSQNMMLILTPYYGGCLLAGGVVKNVYNTNK